MKTRRAFVALLACAVTLASVLVTAPPAQASELDDVRQLGVAQVVDALEDYGLTHNSYVVDGTGYDGEGWGFVEKDNTASYTTSIASALFETPGAYAQDPTGDYWIYQCQDRVAAFSHADSITPSVEDAQWWTDHDCNPYGINSLGLTYFEVSASLTHVADALREVRLEQAIDALNHYGLFGYEVG